MSCTLYLFVWVFAAVPLSLSLSAVLFSNTLGEGISIFARIFYTAQDIYIYLGLFKVYIHMYIRNQHHQESRSSHVCLLYPYNIQFYRYRFSITCHLSEKMNELRRKKITKYKPIRLIWQPCHLHMYICMCVLFKENNWQGYNTFGMPQQSLSFWFHSLLRQRRRRRPTFQATTNLQPNSKIVAAQ